MQEHDHAGLLDEIIHVITLGEKGRAATAELTGLLSASEPSVRYWAAYVLSRTGALSPSSVSALTAAIEDGSASVRTAAARTLAISGYHDLALPVLLRELENSNYVAGLYAALALEDIGSSSPEVLEVFRRAEDSPYEFTRRVARRFMPQHSADAVGAVQGRD